MLTLRLISRLLVICLLASNGYGSAQDLEGELPHIVSQDSLRNSLRAAPLCGLEDVGTPTETTPNDGTKFNPRQLILPGALIAVGIFGTYDHTFKKMNVTIRDEINQFRKNNYFRVDDYIQYLPVLTYLTFGSIGIKAKHNIRERIAIEATAYATMAALTNIAKFSSQVKRPDASARNSFPSGHTAVAFTGAELMRMEYGLGIGIGAYALATTVAFLRIYNGRHWLSDVIGGAGIGILSARIGYWMLPLYRKWFKWNKAHPDVMVIAPSYSPSERNVSINLAYTF